jgi:HSP20 family protein
MIRWRFYEPNPMRDALEQVMRESSRWRESTRGEPMPVNVHETEGELVVEAGLPGVRPEDVDINSAEGLLTIAAHAMVEEKDYHHQEMRSVVYHRQLMLPVDCRWEEARADYEHGILTIRIPKRQPKAPERIRIEVSRGGGGKTPIEAAKGEGYSEVEGTARPARARGSKAGGGAAGSRKRSTKPPG